MEVKIGSFTFSVGRSVAQQQQQQAGNGFSVNVASLFGGLSSKAQIAELYYSSTKGSHAVYSIINRASDIIADTLNYAVHRDANGEVKQDSLAIKSLNNPNANQTMREFFKAYAVNRLLFGEAYVYGIEKIGLDKGTYDLNVAHSQDVDVPTDKTDWLNPPRMLKVASGGKQVSYSMEDFIVVRNYNVNSQTNYGLSPLYPASVLAAKIISADSLEYSSFKQGGTEKVITPKASENTARIGNLNAQDLDDLDKQLNAIDGVKKKALSKPIEVHDIKDSPINLGVLQSTEAAIKALMFVYGIPYSVFNGNATYNNTEESYKVLYTTIGIPYAIEFLDKFAKFIKLENGEYLDIEVDKITQLQNSQLDMITALEKANASINEKRSVVGLPALSGEQYDEPIIPMGVTLGYEESKLEV